MINPEELSPDQVQALRVWAEKGLDLNAIQKKLYEELGLKLTFMDTRFLLQDLEISISRPEPAQEMEMIPESVQESQASQADEFVSSSTPPDPLLGKTQVTVDEITLPHALISGKVLFKSGAQGVWNIDRTGGINWDASIGEPTDDDLREFETELRTLLRSYMGGM